jgi:hypothetical protein
MPGNNTTATARTPSRLPAALTWMPVQLVLLFVVLAAVDLGCQLLGAHLAHATPASFRDAARVLAALILSVAMIAAYRFLVRVLEQRTAVELQASGAVRATAPGVLVGAGLFALVYAILWALGAVSFGGQPGRELGIDARDCTRERRAPRARLCRNAQPVAADRPALRLEFHRGRHLRRRGLRWKEQRPN